MTILNVIYFLIGLNAFYLVCSLTIAKPDGVLKGNFTIAKWFCLFLTVTFLGAYAINNSIWLSALSLLPMGVYNWITATSGHYFDKAEA